jgi:hypothetical protein
MDEEITGSTWRTGDYVWFTVDIPESQKLREDLLQSIQHMKRCVEEAMPGVRSAYTWGVRRREKCSCGK